MGSFVPSNVLIYGILNFSRIGKCSTPAVNEDSVYCTRASIETGARPFTASFMWLSSCWMFLNLCSHDRSPISCWMGPSLLLSLPCLSSLQFSPGGFIRIMLPILASLTLPICFSRRVEVLMFFLGDGVLAFSNLSRLLGVLHLPDELLQFSQQTLVGETECLYLIGIGVQSF